MIFVVPGLIGYALHQKGLIAIPTKMADGQEVLDGDQVFAVMVRSLLPPGLRGLVVGGLLAALMSSLSSLFNSCATLFTVDIYEKIKPKASEQHLVTVGRVATVVVVGMGIIWIPVMQRVSEGGLYKYLQSVQGYLAPPIAAVFMLGLFWKRINGAGAVAGLAIGFIAGMLKLTIQAMTGGEDPLITSPGWLVYVGEYNFLFATGWLLLLSILVIVTVSLCTAPPKPEQIVGLTYATATADQKKESRASWGLTEILLTVRSSDSCSVCICTSASGLTDALDSRIDISERENVRWPTQSAWITGRIRCGASSSRRRRVGNLVRPFTSTNRVRRESFSIRPITISHGRIPPIISRAWK